jgi:integrase
MSISTRQVKNKRDSSGMPTGRAGTVYDVDIKYKTSEGYKHYIKRGFLTKKDAQQHEAETQAKLTNPSYSPVQASQGRISVKEYLDEWVENHGKANLRPSTFASYKSHIKNHIVPYVGHVQLNKLTPAMLDNMFQKLFDQGLSQSTVRYAQRILSVAFEAARKYRYIEHNPARDIITKFGKQGKTPDPYTIEQVRHFMSHIIGTSWEMPVVLAGLYGMRMSEIIGLRWRNVDLENMRFGVVEQMPFKVPAGTKTITEMAPTKSNDRILPITDVTLPYFTRQLELQERQKALAVAGGGTYHDNDFVVAKPDGAPHRRDRLSADFGQLIRHSEMPHIRFHDLRHTAATNMHQLTGDFYTVGEILGHTLKGIGMSLGISTNLEAVTARYVDVRLERKREVLSIYHDAVHATKNLATGAEQVDKQPKRRSKGIEI